MTTQPTPAPAPHEPMLFGPEPTQTDAQPVDAPVAEPGALAALCALGAVRLYHQRANKSLRALPYLAQGSEAREVAEWLHELVEEGSSVAQVALASGLSRATVRRAIENLDLAYDIEDGDLDELVTPDLDAVIFAGDSDGEEQA